MSHLHLDIGEARRRGSDSIGAHPHLRDEQMKKLLQKSSMDKVDWMDGWKQVRRLKESRGHLEEPFGKMENGTGEES